MSECLSREMSRRALRSLKISAAALAILAVWPYPGVSAAADARRAPDTARLIAVVRLMSELSVESRRHAGKIRAIYGPKAGRLHIANRRALRAAVEENRLVVLPPDASAYNLRLRLDGEHPIGELDQAHQELYLAARAQTIGCLLQVASRVQSGPIEVTSLVRHGKYQHRLARANVNARTAVPTHVMGLAFDISILSTPLATAIEIRDVLRRMAADGDLLFIAEQRQLVFHVVPMPRRWTYFAALSEAYLLFPHRRVPAGPVSAAVRRLEVPEFDGAVGDVWIADIPTSYAAYGALLVWLMGSGLAVIRRRSRPGKGTF